MYQAIPKPPIPTPPAPPIRAIPGHLTRVKLRTAGNLTQNEARPVGHLTFLSKRQRSETKRFRNSLIHVSRVHGSLLKLRLNFRKIALKDLRYYSCVFIWQITLLSLKLQTVASCLLQNM